MKKMILLSMLMLLSGCQTVHHEKNAVTKANQKAGIQANNKSVKDSGRACIDQCKNNFKSCRSQCHDNCTKCQKKANRKAWKNFCDYYSRMKIKGTYRPRDWLSFRDPLACRQVTCNCPADLNACIQQCGGRIKKKLRATPYCQ